MREHAEHTGPRVGITCDLLELNGRERAATPWTYVSAVLAAGGRPLILPPAPGMARGLLDAVDAVVLTGGFDPRLEPFGGVTDRRVTPVHPDRQAFETELLAALEAERPDTPVLGVCLGMQMMGLCAGGALDQWMGDGLDPQGRHRGGATHRVEPAVEGGTLAGEVHSHHRQALTDAGSMRVAARADDGVIEAIDDPRRAFYLGVQWHAEQTADHALGAALFGQLVEAARTGGQAASGTPAPREPCH